MTKVKGLSLIVGLGLLAVTAMAVVGCSNGEAATVSEPSPPGLSKGNVAVDEPTTPSEPSATGSSEGRAAVEEPARSTAPGEVDADEVPLEQQLTIQRLGAFQVQIRLVLGETQAHQLLVHEALQLLPTLLVQPGPERKALDVACQALL